jgi:ketol-acid reductoisomerase
MAKVYYEKDAHLQNIADLAVGIIGYGNQGRAHALNLRDSGMNVKVGARKSGKAYEQALHDHFTPVTVEDIATNCDVLALLLPDEMMAEIYTNSIEPYITSGKTFVFAHGFAVHHKLLRLPDTADLLLVAPTGPGKQLRSLYLQNQGLPALVAVEQDSSGDALAKALAYAKGIGCTRGGCIQTTFAEETVVDLYCEQTVLCGGVPELIKRSFDNLVAAGYQPELAYISCLKEVKLIADLLFSEGIDGMRERISSTARYGALISGPMLINAQSDRALQKILQGIESGKFAHDFLEEADLGHPAIKAQAIEGRHSLLSRTGKRLRELLRF